ncbi:hypothetical protein [Photobacterium kishitanii]|uniref:hypothetical protein n=1 Tax=Photobacterium kishitanii TaxID=318456 RepID=UPI0011B227BB|nr:hypothetical protein [Photobacterium kishitanii]
MLKHKQRLKLNRKYYPFSEESKQSDVIAHALEKGKAVLSPTTLAHQIETSEIKAVPMVQMTAKEAKYLRKRDAILTALENAGVDNWIVSNTPLVPFDIK